MENKIIHRSADMVPKAALKAAEELLKDHSKDLTALLARQIPALAAAALSAFSIQFIVLCLTAITAEEKSNLILEQVNRSVEPPLKTPSKSSELPLLLRNTSITSPQSKQFIEFQDIEILFANWMSPGHWQRMSRRKQRYISLEVWRQPEFRAQNRSETSWLGVRKHLPKPR